MNPSLVQNPAPDFTCTALVDGNFQDITLSAYRGRYVVLFFYPLDFTFVCPTEILAFSDRIEEFRALDAEVLGVSVDSHYSHLAWSQRPRAEGGIEGVGFPLLGDVKREVCTKYGVLLPEGVALRGLFVIDPEGIVRHVTVNDLPIGRSVDEVLRTVQALRFHAQHGEVCPADWSPGSKGMKADPVGSKEFFGASA